MHFFHQNIEALRRFCRYKKTEIAEWFGVSSTAVANWEKGTEPKLEQVVIFSKKYGVTLDQLFFEELTPGRIAELKSGGQDESGRGESDKLKAVIGEMTVEARERESETRAEAERLVRAFDAVFEVLEEGLPDSEKETKARKEYFETREKVLAAFGIEL